MANPNLKFDDQKYPIDKLEEFKNETVQFYQQKAFKEAYLYVVSRIMTRVRERLSRGLDSTYHVVVNNFYVSRFTEYSPKSGS